MSTYPPPQQHEPSIGQAFDYSLQWTKRLLLPFDFGKWMGLLLVLFIATLFQSGAGNPFFQLNGRQTKQLIEWINTNPGPTMAIAAGLFLVSCCVYAVVMWVRARGEFMFLDAVLTGEARISDSWSAFARQGNSLTLAYFCFWFVGALYWAIAGSFVGMKILEAVSNAESSSNPWHVVTQILQILIPPYLIYLPIGVILWIFGVFVYDFVIPIMYRRRLTFLTAWSAFWGLLSSRPGRFVVYLLARFLIGLGVGFLLLVAMTLACVLTCCMISLPFLNRIPQLPFMIFSRSFPVFYLEQFGPEWEIFPRTPQQLVYADPVGNPPNQYVQ